jgi:tripartite-type tricarboxylate transporter receptor subunit TctC
MLRLSRRGLLAAGLFSPGIVSAQGAFPSAPIRFVIAFPPGGPSDILGRLVARKITEQKGWQVVVENRAGASGLIGMGEVARAAPDGYTVLINASAHSILPTTHKDKAPFDIPSAFLPITILGRTPLLVTTTPSLPIHNIAELLAYARANPGKLNFTAGSPGGGPHLGATLFRLTTGIDIQFIPYRGSGPALQDLAAGNVQLGFDSMTASAGLARGGQIRPIAVTSLTRNRAFPDVPSVAETVPGFEADTWVAAFLPARTPPALQAAWHEAFAAAIAAPDVTQRIQELGTEPGGQSPAEFDAVLKREIAMWADVVAKAGIKVE